MQWQCGSDECPCVHGFGGATGMTVYVQLLKYHRVEEGIGPDLHGAVPNTLNAQ